MKIYKGNYKDLKRKFTCIYTNYVACSRLKLIYTLIYTFDLNHCFILLFIFLNYSFIKFCF